MNFEVLFRPLRDIQVIFLKKNIHIYIYIYIYKYQMFGCMLFAFVLFEKNYSFLF